MFEKGHKGYSILHNKCPRCHEGAFYKSGNPYRLRGLLALHETCDRCGLRYVLETGFWYGAMYVNYALGVAITGLVFLVASGLLGVGLEDTLCLAVGVLLLLTPVVLKLSRLIWINFFVHYDPKATQAFAAHKASENAR